MFCSLFVSGLLGKEVNNDIPYDRITVNFDQFCSIVAEFKMRESESRKLWEIILAKAYNLFQVLFSPLIKILGILMSKNQTTIWMFTALCRGLPASSYHTITLSRFH